MIKTDENGKLARTESTAVQKEAPTIKSILLGAGMKNALAMALPKHVKAERIVRVALTAIEKNPALAKCTLNSFFGSLLSAAQLGLEVNTPLGLAYLIPYGSDCQLQIGYMGMIDIAHRSSVPVRGHVVREGDAFDYELGLEQKLVHKPNYSDEQRESRPVTFVYAVADMPNGMKVFTVLSRAEVEKYRNRSKSKNNGPWVTDWDAMAVKTAVRRLFRWLPKSVEMRQAAAIDEAHERDAQRDAYDSSVTEALGVLQLTGDTVKDAEFVEEHK